jgi:hypothetical protein
VPPTNGSPAASALEYGANAQTAVNVMTTRLLIGTLMFLPPSSANRIGFAKEEPGGDARANRPLTPRRFWTPPGLHRSGWVISVNAAVAARPIHAAYRPDVQRLSGPE